MCHLPQSSKRFFPPVSSPRCSGMEDQMENSSSADVNGEANHNTRSSHSHVIDIYPLNGYYFGSKEALVHKNEANLERLQRLKANYLIHGMRICVEAVMLVELFKHPHLLVLQWRNTFFKLPGGRLRPGESEAEGLKRKLSTKLLSTQEGMYTDWEIGECLGMWWRSDFGTMLSPQMPVHAQRAKECTKLFLVKLPRSRRFMVPKNLKLLAIPLKSLHENQETYGPVISGVPQLLSRFSFNLVGN